jgi:cytochrome b561
MAKPNSYSPLQKILHWLIALLVLGMLAVGLYMVYRGNATNFDDLTNTLYTWHKTVGFVVLWLVVVRAFVRLTRGAPPPEPSLNILQRIAAEVTHLGIYLLLLVVPVLGWVGVSAYGARGVVGGLSLPELIAKDDGLGERILWLHGWAAYALGALIAGHIGAALLHRFILRDGVFQRMWPSHRRDG